MAERGVAMTAIFIAREDALLSFHPELGHWESRRHLDGLAAQCLASDPLRPERIYCGTFGHGLWISEDGGRRWHEAGPGIEHQQITAVAVSRTERAGAAGVIWAGTEPSALFRSEDGGRNWRPCPALLELPSAPTWSFPPRPHTSHVRWIAPDPHLAGRLLVSIEAGGVMRSLDGGLSWEDRRPDGPYDAHTLATHPLAPGRVYAAAGGDGLMRPGHGYFESYDAGASWRTSGAEMDFHYLWGLVVDPRDPDTLLVSASPSPFHAHNPDSARSTIYRKVGDGPWQDVCPLPERDGAQAYLLATDGVTHGFYAACNQGLFASFSEIQRGDELRWLQLPVPWPEAYRRQYINALLVIPMNVDVGD
jgi:hypothetical protein